MSNVQFWLSVWLTAGAVGTSIELARKGAKGTIAKLYHRWWLIPLAFMLCIMSGPIELWVSLQDSPP